MEKNLEVVDSSMLALEKGELEKKLINKNQNLRFFVLIFSCILFSIAIFVVEIRGKFKI